MDWDKLRVFHAVAEAGSFTHAGEKLNLSQSAVSRQISALEGSLKVPLFHRHARGLILTEQGEVLYRTAHEVFGKLAMTEAVLHREQGPAERRPQDQHHGGLRLYLAGAAHEGVPRHLSRRSSVHLILSDRYLDLSMRRGRRRHPPAAADPGGADPAPPLDRAHPHLRRGQLHRTPRHAGDRGGPRRAPHHRLRARHQPAGARRQLAAAHRRKGPRGKLRKPALTVNNVYADDACGPERRRAGRPAGLHGPGRQRARAGPRRHRRPESTPISSIPRSSGRPSESPFSAIFCCARSPRRDSERTSRSEAKRTRHSPLCSGRMAKGIESACHSNRRASYVETVIAALQQFTAPGALCPRSPCRACGTRAREGLRILRLPDVKPPCSTCRGLAPRLFLPRFAHRPGL